MQGSKIWGSNSDVAKDSSLFECDTVDRWAFLGLFDL
jgi:hypothetical protein